MVDLYKLSVALMPRSHTVVDRPTRAEDGDRRINVGVWTIFDDGVVRCEGVDVDWKLVDIIRKHVSPAPAGELRERIAKAVLEYMHPVGKSFRSDADGIADAVLAVLNGEGER